MKNKQIIKSDKESCDVNTGKYGIIILAAGNSIRLGKDKQMLRVQGETLLKRSSKKALAAKPDQVVVVLGEKAHLHQKELQGLDLSIALNSGSSEGIASSIRIGIDHLQSLYPAIEYAIIMLCDQPYVTSGHLKGLIDLQYQSKAKIVASFYGGQKGVPALFHRSCFPRLMELKGNSGAKQLFADFEGLETLALSKGEVDIDTMEDYLNLIDRLGV
ncbi:MULTISPECIES: nucleotidyltransferase family protein [Echinicola]|uniref:MobA-like NTP transferase domain-containing protein n=2 Tax=Echinicola TaxID=390846 RepID=A0ABQ1V954_9BACT|nr:MULTISPECIES: nucleotidyltransferase family protein [Echinicola]AGA80355.1 putative MobA-like protein [Echinicola vietnamensis DSM 17526]GGF43172.1 hypothetical protein GCM10011339_34610 [Echinicola rosea]